MKKTDNKAENKNDSFKMDEALKRLGEIVKKLEVNDCELDQALKLFEEGVSITKQAHLKLNEAEAKIEILVKANADGMVTKSFEEE